MKTKKNKLTAPIAVACAALTLSVAIPGAQASRAPALDISAPAGELNAFPLVVGAVLAAEAAVAALGFAYVTGYAQGKAEEEYRQLRGDIKAPTAEKLGGQEWAHVLD